MILLKAWHKRLMEGIRKAIKLGKYSSRNRKPTKEAIARFINAENLLKYNPKLKLRELADILDCSIGTAWSLKKKIVGKK